jgi:fructokinase
VGLRIGIDLGGTKIEGLVLDEGGGEIIRRRIPTPRGDYGAIVQGIAAFAGALAREAGGKWPPHLGVGIPGVISPATGLVKNANITELNGHPFDRDLSGALGREVRVQNDANCFALSEAVDGAGQGAGVVFGVIIGTGVGGGLVVHGRIIGGRHLIGGEWGHNPLPWPSVDEVENAPPCFCGKRGCNETWISGPAFAEDHARRAGHHPAAARLTAQEIATAAATDAVAAQSLARWMDRLARGLAGIVNLLDPDVIVLGGGLSNIAQVYREVPALMRPFVTSDQFTTPILKARHGDSSGVRGAAWL